MNIDQARFNMVEQQVRTWEVLDSRILQLLQEVPREDFVPSRYAQLAFADLSIPLEHDQVMMRPIIEGRMLQALDLQGSESVLEIGTGSGFVTACLARLAATVHSVEYFEDLSRRAARKLDDHAVANCQLFVGDALENWEPPQQYDVIVVTGSVQEIPAQFLRWLQPNGRLFIIVGESPLMEAMLLNKQGDHQTTGKSLFETDLQALIHSTRPEPFAF
ncbi:MAG: protein-L-isoaspartate O-methyltransferase [Wenzhouxiangellaceae bacterium]